MPDDKQDQRLEPLFSEADAVQPEPGPAVPDDGPAAEAGLARPASPDAKQPLFARLAGFVRRLNYPQKFVLISLLFTLPLASFYPLVQQQVTRRDQYGTKELYGTLYLRPLQDLLAAVQAHERAVLPGGDPARALALRAEVQAQFDTLSGLNEQYGAALQLDTELADLHAAWESLRYDVGLLSEAGLRDRHARLVAAIRALISRVGDTSFLILDPDLDTYYMMDAVLLRLPESQDLLAQELVLIQDLISQGEPDADQRAQLIVLSALLRANTTGLNNNVRVGLDQNAAGDMRPLVEAPLESAVAATERFLELADARLINAPGGTAEPSDLASVREAGLLAIEANARFYDAASQALELGVRSRIARFTSEITFALAVALAGAGVAFWIGLAMMRAISRPLSQLTDATQRLAAGDMSSRVAVTGQDEVSQVSQAFNHMAGELERGRASLEALSRDMALAAQVGHQLTRVRSLADLLAESVDLIQAQFGLYQVQVYLLDAAGRTLGLRAGTGAAGAELLRRGHRLPVGPGSINGLAAAERRPILVADSAASSLHRPNALLPETRSELAVPLLSGDLLIGVLALHSDRPGAFSEAHLAVFETLAGQLSTAVQNANLFAEAAQARADVEAQARRMAHAGWDDFLNAIERGERLGFVYEPAGLRSLDPAETSVPSGLAAPIVIAGEQVGMLRLDGASASSEGDAGLIQAVADQVAQQLENLRVLARAERYRSEAEEAARRLTREGWSRHAEEAAGPVHGFVYDQNEVKPLARSASQAETVMVQSVPLLVRGEAIGDLSVAGIDELDDRAAELISAVAEKLSVRLEAVRLFEQTQSALTEQSRLAAELDIQHNFLDSVIESLPVMLVVKDADNLSMVRLNRAGEELLGLSREALLGRTDYDVFSRAQADFSMSKDREALARGELVDIPEEPLQTAHKGLRYLHTRKVPLLDADGRPRYLLSISEDVTERKAAEARLREAEDRFRNLVEQLPAITYTVDIAESGKEGRTSYISPQVESLLGYTPEEWVADSDLWIKLLDPQDREAVLAEVRRQNELGTTLSLEYRSRTRDGRIVWFHNQNQALFDEHGRPRSVHGLMFDITERKQAEELLAKRAVELETVAKVGTAAATLLEAGGLLQTVVDLTKTSFGLYHAHVYLLDEAGQSLVLAAGAGEVGRRMTAEGRRIPLNRERSLVAQAARGRKGVIVNDVRAAADFLPHPLLPDTRAELAVPMIVGDRLLGVFDVQSDTPGRFSDEDVRIQATLAAQVAVALQNAASYTAVAEARAQIEAQARRLTRQGWQDFLNAVDHSERIGYVYDLNAVRPLAEPLDLGGTPRGRALTQPIVVTGEPVGLLAVDGGDGRTWRPDEADLVAAVAGRLAQQVENLRLLDQAEQYRAEAENAVRRLTHEGWTSYTSGALSAELGYVYDQNQVAPLAEGAAQVEAPVLASPLTVRGETIGRVAVAGGEALDPEQAELVAMVSAQLSAHIENLRLTEQAQQRAAEMETVAQVTTAASTLLEADTLLQTVVDLAKSRFGLYHAHIYLLSPSGDDLVLAAGAGTIGHKMVSEGRHIPLSWEQSLVARAARQRQPVVENDVRRSPDFLPHRLLPDTRSELALPMIAGSTLLGVFDVQSDIPHRFSQEDVRIQSTLAAQVAVALQNANLYADQAATLNRLRELDHLKSSFLANMSHELRTPLNSILGFTEVMLEELDGPLTPQMENDLRIVYRNGQHLLSLISDVLDMAKIEAGKMVLNPEAFDLSEVLEDVLGTASPLARTKSLALQLEIDRTPGVLRLEADRMRLRQVMINLVNNAIKFTETGSVSVLAEHSLGWVRVTVQDTGLGIPPDQLEKIFQEFTQVDSSTTRKAGGTGLGLPISRHLVEMHGGRLWAESTGVAGEGSAFIVELPVNAAYQLDLDE